MDPEALAAVVGAPVSSLVRLSGGASRQTFRFEADGRPLIVQRDRDTGFETRPGMQVEAILLDLARKAGVPVAGLVASGGADGPLGAPYLVTELVEGETIARRLLRDDEFADARTVLAHQAGVALAAIHSMPVEPVEDRLQESDPVESSAKLLDLFDEPHPAFELGVRWLDRNRPAGHGRVVVHGDFRTGNLVVGPDGLRAVLDWELSHIGDPAEDLGWFCGRAWRFGSPKHAGGFGTLDDLLAGYRDGGGAPIDADDVRWWEAYGTLRWGIVCLVQAASHLNGSNRSVEMATIGRRTCEAEWDLLELISSTAPHDRPSAAELVEAVRDLLDGEVRDALDGRLRFQVRIASNALSMVGRELELGAAEAGAHAERLAALGVADDRALADAIRSGDLDDRWDDVLAAVRDAVVDKLAVAHPGYTHPDT